MTKAEFVNKVLPVKDKLFRMAGRFLGTVDAEDVVQDVFVKLWNRKADLGKYKSLDAFALVITRNLCLDKIKSKGYKKDELTQWNEVANEKNPEQLTELKDEVGMVRQAMGKLPEQQAMIIQMRDIEEMDYDEIAEVMQMNVNAIRVNLSRARKAIRDQLIKKHAYENSRY